MTRTTSEISLWLAERIAHYSEVAKESIDIKADISSFRLDSLLIVNVTTELGEWMEMDIHPTLLWEMRTIEAISEWIVENQDA